MEALRAWRDRNDELGECLQRMWRPWPQDASEWVRGRNTSNGATALYYAARYGEHELVSILLDAGAVVNTATNNGATPLFIAAYEGHEAVVRRLLEAGADVNKATNIGATPLSIATVRRHRAVARLLTDAGAV